MNAGFIFFLESKLARFAGPGFVLFQEVLYTPLAHFDKSAASWAFHFSIDDGKVLIGFLKASKHQQFASPL